MGQKVNPHGLRVGVIKDWDSKWYAEGDFADYLVEDYNHSLCFHSQQTLLLPLLRTAVHLRLSFSYKTLLNIVDLLVCLF